MKPFAAAPTAKSKQAVSAACFACFLVLPLLNAAGPSPAAEADSSPSRFASAVWIAPPPGSGEEASLPLLRREFEVEERPVSAKLRVIGLGDYEPRLNGRRISSTGINQPWSQYEKTLYCREFDVTESVRVGSNCVGVLLTNSFWHNVRPPEGRYFKDGPQRSADEPLMLLAEVELHLPSGETFRVGSDEAWKTHPGPITFSHIFAGEDYDARREQPGWDAPGFDASHWTASRKVTAPRAALLPESWPPVESEQRFAPTSISEAAPGIWLYAFPQNCSAQLAMRLSGGESGDRIAVRCGEHRSPEGRLFGHYVVDCSITTTGQPLNRRWSSFYTGMRFVEVTGAVPRGQPNPDGLPVIDAMELAHVRASMDEIGDFRCSSETLNGAHRVIDWAMRSNSHHVLTDCPHREKLGWLEVAYLMAPSFQYRFDCGAWHDKILRDIRDAQEPNGRVTTVAPSYPSGRFPDKFNWTVEWGAAAVLLPWSRYEWSGDRRVLEENFDTMRRFVDFVGEEATKCVAPGGLGDWYDYGHGQPPGPSRFTPPELSATATWALCVQRVADAADVLDKSDLVARYRELFDDIGEAFRRRFRNPASGDLKHLGSPQCANAMALCAGLVPEGDRERLVDQIVADLKRRGWQQTAGDIGHAYVIRALAEAGRSDVLHRVYGRTGPGSYGGVLEKGLTTMPETWDATMDGYQSLNHCMLGHAMEWCYGYVAGVRQQPGSVGWSDVLIAPVPGPLTHAEASVVTPRGRIASRWRIHAGRFVLEAEVPNGVRAVAKLPSGATHTLHAGERTLTEQWSRDRAE